MRIGIDAHIVLPKHKRYDPRIARYTEQLITYLLKADKKQEHTWVLFFDSRMNDTTKFERPNVEIKHFPFVHYRKYLPVIYSHMLISSFLTAARLDVFHSPEGLIPFMYPGRIITTFHYIPQGETESNLFVRTFMLGARAAFAQLCKRARRIVVNKPADKKLLASRHSYPEDRIIVLEADDLEHIAWPNRVRTLMKVYKEMTASKKKAKAAASKSKVAAKANKAKNETKR